MKAYQTYLFDWDGTLARTTEVWLAEIKRALIKRGIAISDAENARRLGDLSVFAELGLAADEIKVMCDEIDNAVHALLPKVGLYEHALETVRMLKQRGCKLAIVTSTWRASFDIVMRNQPIEPLIDVVVTGDDVVHAKPDPECARLAMQKLQADPKTTVMVGDNYKDIMLAHETGIDSILFYPEAHKLLYSLDELKRLRPTYVVGDLSEIITNSRAEVVK